MKKVLIVIVAILLLAGIPVTVFFVGQNQELRSKAAPATSLAITPAISTLKVGETAVLNIEINTGENRVASAKLSFIFDQTKLEAQSITSGPLAKRIISPGVLGPGSATITVAADSSAKPITGKGIVAVLRVKALDTAQGSDSISFGGDTFVAGIGEKPVNVLVGNTPATLTFSGSTLTQNPENLTSFEKPATSSSTLSPTPTILPSLSTTPISSDSSLTVTISENASDSAKPIIQGKAPPGSTITVVIHSDPITDVVVADANGDWTYSPTTDLDPGDHTVVVTADSATGSAQSQTSTFTIDGGIGGTDVSTLSGMPESGSTSPFLLLLIVSGMLVLVGIIYPFAIK